ncbi:hypothetical protein MVG78_00355 [Roseomonas gilardii subsp. gilardii]|uniref:hypothetical protein n=1 Tax=Roseomonas gilardii TaxID=257708 RepID=UPI001FFA0CE5|nr:hypothetical protein [Roseomonas gilardii]UPG72689.1 hypothetical protein MVG78_00355 [Roseomonas gilardii subsp. gilardii]
MPRALIRLAMASAMLAGLAACAGGRPPGAGAAAATSPYSAGLGPTQLVPGRDMDHPLASLRPSPDGMEPTVDANSPARITN